MEDDDNTFRFDYSREFLIWALTPPGFLNKWYVGIRDTDLNNELIASITGVPVTVCTENDKVKMCEINFLCVHKNYRSKKLAALLIAEVTRQVNLRNKWQAVNCWWFRSTLQELCCQLLSPKQFITIDRWTPRNWSRSVFQVWPATTQWQWWRNCTNCQRRQPCPWDLWWRKISPVSPNSSTLD